jgi:hypothetical protein
VGGASEDDAEELLAFVEKLRADVLGWLAKYHPELYQGVELRTSS